MDCNTSQPVDGASTLDCRSMTTCFTEADEARASIDEQIKQLKETIRSLNSARNAYAPISKLPPELLLHVFRYAHEPESGEIRASEYLEHRLAWRELNAIAVVCRTWRLVALGCPTLWSRLAFPGYTADILEEMILRAKTSPLLIQLTSRSTFLLNRLSPALRSKILNIENMRELHVMLQHEGHMKEVMDGISGDNATKMQSLIVRNESDYVPTCDISSKVLSAPMPQLRHLSIYSCNVQWDALQSCVSHSLLLLRLSHVTEPSRAAFFSLLSQIPNLKVLHLAKALPPISPLVLGESVALPNLESCTIEWSSIFRCLDFQKHVSYPVTKATLKFVPSTSTESEGSMNHDFAAGALLSSCGITVDIPQRTHSCLFLEIGQMLRIVLSDDSDEYEPTADALRVGSYFSNSAVTID